MHGNGLFSILSKFNVNERRQSKMVTCTSYRIVSHEISRNLNGKTNGVRLENNVHLNCSFPDNFFFIVLELILKTYICWLSNVGFCGEYKKYFCVVIMLTLLLQKVIGSKPSITCNLKTLFQVFFVYKRRMRAQKNMKARYITETNSPTNWCHIIFLHSSYFFLLQCHCRISVLLWRHIGTQPIMYK